MPSTHPTTLKSALAAGVLSLLLPSDISALMAHETAPAGGRPQPSIIETEPLPHDMEMTALRLHVPPGGASPAHHHAGTLFVYMLRGHVRSRLNDGNVVRYGPGDSWTEPEGTRHSLFENASDSEPAELLVVFAAPAGATLTTIDD